MDSKYGADKDDVSYRKCSLFEHYASDVPTSYDTSTVTVWRED